MAQLFLGHGVTFLVSQVGAHSSRLWSERLRSAGLDSHAVMLFWNVASAEDRSQRELADAFQLPASRIVGLVDALEQQGWLERRTKAGDRRAQGRRLLARVMAIAADHEERFTRGLQSRERAALAKLLSKVAATQGLIAKVDPDC